ncbi:lytic transglycosylase domain-containing protein [Rubrobacter marinus]|uniref:lytic transglycosylase domain-containing protein n=1 Tax=Rubrobacter marinus TaxID=2653852 RepID=UPI00224BA280|nr:lytic transglycosylase domain-containing protein [Rubrobacter marinus]
MKRTGYVGVKEPAGASGSDARGQGGQGGPQDPPRPACDPGARRGAAVRARGRDDGARQLGRGRGGNLSAGGRGCLSRHPSGTSGASGPSYVSQEWGEEALSDVPEEYLSLYEEAASEYGLDAAVLAAIGKIETDHGRHGGTCATSSAGAQGPMQFIPSTWANVGVDGNGDGRKDVCDPEDAIPSAANYLKLSGAPRDYHSAILAYNGAEWYYQDVVAQAARYRTPDDGGDGMVSSGADPAAGKSSGLATILSPFATRSALAEEAVGTVGSPGRPTTPPSRSRPSAS